MTVENIQLQLREFAQERDWEKFHTLKNLILALVGETGELAAVVQWLDSVDQEFFKDNPEVFSAFEEEVADVFIYLARIADISGIDLLDAAQRKMQKNAERYTVDKSRGNAQKQ